MIHVICFPIKNIVPSPNSPENRSLHLTYGLFVFHLILMCIIITFHHSIVTFREWTSLVVIKRVYRR